MSAVCLFEKKNIFWEREKKRKEKKRKHPV
jgi:hypothetical protein